MSLVRSGSAPPSQITWEGDLPDPTTTYAASFRNSPLASNLTTQPSTNKSGSAVVSRRPRRNGLRFWYAHGASAMPTIINQPGNSGVHSSAFQQYWVNLFAWQINRNWYIAYPRNLGYTFRSPQLVTKSTGGPTNSRMTQAPVFPRVQRIPRATVTPRVYQTHSQNSTAKTNG